MKKRRKKWVTPKLIVYLRSRIAESVMLGCKAGPATGGPASRCVFACFGACVDITAS